MGDSTEVGPLEILRVSFLLGNGQAPSDIPSDTKNSIREDFKKKKSKISDIGRIGPPTYPTPPN